MIYNSNNSNKSPVACFKVSVFTGKLLCAKKSKKKRKKLLFNAHKGDGTTCYLPVGVALSVLFHLL